MAVDAPARCHFSSPHPLEVSSLCSLSSQWTGTFQRDQELNQNYISLAIPQTSEMVHSHWLLEAQGARGGLVIITLCIHRPLFSKEHLQILPCNSPYY